MWSGYCAFYKTAVPEEVTALNWKRILDPVFPLCSLMARNSNGAPLGFANFLTHPRTWDVRDACYLEDLYVDPENRGQGVGYALISRLKSLCGERGWCRLYWHTEDDNETARRLYDRFSPADGFVRYKIGL